MIVDLHVHTSISPCSRLTIADILRCARGLGLDGLCITDHQTMGVGRHLSEGIQPDGLLVIFGMEYSTEDGDFLIFGDVEDVPRHLAAEDMLRYVDRSGGVAVAAHPFRRNRPTSEAVIWRGWCRAIEGVNGRNDWDENTRIRQWLDRYPLAVCGGSDAHSLEELGRVATRFERPVRCREDLVAQIRQGRCWPHRMHNAPADVKAAAPPGVARGLIGIEPVRRNLFMSGAPPNP